MRYAMIRVRNLSAGYEVNKHYSKVLNDISFAVNAGELVCLMGPNGSGKSTLLRSISGLQQFKQGQVEINQTSIDQLKPDELAKLLSIVLTEQVVSTQMTVGELIAMGRYPYLSWHLKFEDRDLELIKQVASQCGVEELLEKNIHDLSDGQRQKVMIARALAQEGKIMILDEPTSHLDLNNRVEIINLLKKLSRTESKAIIMATHELDLALQMADRLLLLNYDGHLVEGIPEDLVLNGKLDEVFAFKGYDLKTGKVVHPQTGKQIGLKGSGYAYLWTKNALERFGFEIGGENNDAVQILEEQDKIRWSYAGASFNSISELLEFLNKR